MEKAQYFYHPDVALMTNLKIFEDRGNMFVRAIASLLDEEKNAENF